MCADASETLTINIRAEREQAFVVPCYRFIFHECVSVKLDNKVTFPLMGLSVTPPALLQRGTPHPYNLYACVCHYGGENSANHYFRCYCLEYSDCA
jgi:ubiquitin carboxyl-terminal hydrolase 4/11/15